MSINQYSFATKIIGVIGMMVGVWSGGVSAESPNNDVGATVGSQSSSGASAVSEGSQSFSGVIFSPESTMEESMFSVGLGLQLHANTPDLSPAPGFATLVLPGGGVMQVPMEQRVQNILGLFSSGTVEVSRLLPEQQIVF